MEAALRSVEVDLVRECPDGCCSLVENEVAEALRTCRDIAIGGRERSFLTGSISACEDVLGRRLELDLCNPLVIVGLLVFAFGGGGRMDPLLVVLPVALGGRPVVEVLRVMRVGGFTGNRLGLCDALSGRAAVICSF